MPTQRWVRYHQPRDGSARSPQAPVQSAWTRQRATPRGTQSVHCCWHMSDTHWLSSRYRASFHILYQRGSHGPSYCLVQHQGWRRTYQAVQGSLRLGCCYGQAPCPSPSKVKHRRVTIKYPLCGSLKDAFSFYFPNIYSTFVLMCVCSIHIHTITTCTTLNHFETTNAVCSLPLGF